MSSPGWNTTRPANPRPPWRPREPGRAGLLELLRSHPGLLALGASLDLAEAFGYYGILALLPVVVLPNVGVSAAAIPILYIIANAGGLAGGLVMSSIFEKAGRRRTVAACYALAAAGVGLLAWATTSGSLVWVTVAFAASAAFATAAWTSAYPMFTELFPTHLRAAGVGASVGIGRIGAIVSTLALPGIAVAIGPAYSYLLVAAFWVAGLAAVGIYTARGGVEAAGTPLEALATT